MIVVNIGFGKYILKNDVKGKVIVYVVVILYYKKLVSYM